MGAALAARGALLAYRLIVLETPLNRLGGSDVAGWLGMARHLARHGDLSYWLMGARPPLFPLTVALVSRLGGDRLEAAILQAVFGALAALAGYLLARRLLIPAEPERGERCALLAGVILAVDPASVSASAALLADALFALLMTAFLLALTRYIQGERQRDLALSVLWMALAMLTRPTAIYLWLAAPLMLIPTLRRWQRPALALAAAGLAVYCGWSTRNLIYHGVFTYSLQSHFSLLFLRALSAEHLATGAELDTLQTEYVRELYRRTGNQEALAGVDRDRFWDFLVAPTPKAYHEMGRMAREKLLRYWPAALAGTAIGAWRMLAITDGLPGWFRPVELAYHAALYGLMLAGAARAIRQRDWLLLAMTAIPILYISGLTLAAQTSAMDTRMRTSITAPIAILAIYGAAGLRRPQRAASARVSSPTRATGINP